MYLYDSAGLAGGFAHNQFEGAMGGVDVGRVENLSATDLSIF